MNDKSEFNPVDAALADYLQRSDRGERIDIEQFIKEHPEIEAELQAYFADSENIRRLLDTSANPESPETPAADANRTVTLDHTPATAKEPQADQRAPRQATTPEEVAGTSLSATVDSDARPAIPGSTASFTRPPVKLLGGRFQIVRFHAQGGLGRVSVARDEEVYREVVIKELLQNRAADPEAGRRLLLEAEITGGLEHPGVAPVYGLGKYADGRPFYAMRFIRGLTLKSAISKYHAEAEVQGALELRRLLGHFIAVCHVIHYAHCRGVIHCDLKPSNVMLGKFGETLVVDWGLARLTESGGDASTGEALLRPRAAAGLTRSQSGRVSGTLAYMSPEQACGAADLGPASDLFSLGAVLYCILTNRAPYQGEHGPELLQQARDAAFVRPRQLRPGIPAALEAICLKAMQREPDARYASARALAEDMERWLADEAVSAHQETAWERLGRWTRRHRAWVQAGVVTLLLVSVILALATFLINRERRVAVALSERNRELAQCEAAAKEEAVMRFAETRRAVDTWLTGMSEALQYYPGMQRARLRLLHKAAEEYERFALQHSDDLDLELERGRSYLRLGDVRRLLNDTDSARKAYGKAEALLAELSRRVPENTESRVEWANSEIAAAAVMVDCGQHREADVAYRSALQRLQSLPASSRRMRPALEALAQALHGHGTLLIATDRQAEAEDRLRAARGVMGDLNSANASQPQDHLTLASIQASLAQLMALTGRYEEALVVLDLALAASVKLVETDPDHPKYLETLATVRVYRATILRCRGFYAEEIEAYQAAIRNYESLDKALPDVPTHRESLAITRTDLAQALHQAERNVAARAEIEQAMPILDRLSAQYPTEPRFLQNQAAARDILAQILLDLAQPAQALPLCKAALETYEQLSAVAPDIPGYRERVAVTRAHFARATHARGEHGPAKTAFETAIRELEQLLHDSPDLSRYRNEKAHALVHFGTLLYEAGDRSAAHKAFDAASQAWCELVDPSMALDALYNAGWLWLTALDESSRDPQAALKLAGQLLEKAPGNAVYLNLLGVAYYRNGQWAKALESLQAAERARKSEHAFDSFFLAMVRSQLHEPELAQAQYQRASRWMEINCPGNRRMLAIQAEAKTLLDRNAKLVSPK